MDVTNFGTIYAGINRDSKQVKSQSNDHLRVFQIATDPEKPIQEEIIGDVEIEERDESIIPACSASVFNTGVPGDYQKCTAVNLKTQTLAISNALSGTTPPNTPVLAVLNTRELVNQMPILRFVSSPTDGSEINDVDISPNGELISYVTDKSLIIIPALPEEKPAIFKTQIQLNASDGSFDKLAPKGSALVKAKFFSDTQLVVAFNHPKRKGFTFAHFSISKAKNSNEFKLVPGRYKKIMSQSGVTSLDCVRWPDPATSDNQQATSLNLNEKTKNKTDTAQNLKQQPASSSGSTMGYVAFATADFSVGVCSLDTLKPLWVQKKAHNFAVTSVSLSRPCPKFVASSSAANTVTVAALPDPTKNLYKKNRPMTVVYSLASIIIIAVTAVLLQLAIQHQVLGDIASFKSLNKFQQSSSSVSSIISTETQPTIEISSSSSSSSSYEPSSVSSVTESVVVEETVSVSTEVETETVVEKQPVVEEKSIEPPVVEKIVEEPVEEKATVEETIVEQPPAETPQENIQESSEPPIVERAAENIQPKEEEVKVEESAKPVESSESVDRDIFDTVTDSVGSVIKSVAGEPIDMEVNNKNSKESKESDIFDSMTDSVASIVKSVAGETDDAVSSEEVAKKDASAETVNTIDSVVESDTPIASSVVDEVQSAASSVVGESSSTSTVEETVASSSSPEAVVESVAEKVAEQPEEEYDTMAIVDGPEFSQPPPHVTNEEKVNPVSQIVEEVKPSSSSTEEEEVKYEPVETSKHDKDTKKDADNAHIEIIDNVIVGDSIPAEKEKVKETVSQHAEPEFEPVETSKFDKDAKKKDGTVGIEIVDEVIVGDQLPGDDEKKSQQTPDASEKIIAKQVQDDDDETPKFEPVESAPLDEDLVKDAENVRIEIVNEVIADEVRQENAAQQEEKVVATENEKASDVKSSVASVESNVESTVQSETANIKSSIASVGSVVESSIAKAATAVTQVVNVDAAANAAQSVKSYVESVVGGSSSSSSSSSPSATVEPSKEKVVVDEKVPDAGDLFDAGGDIDLGIPEESVVLVGDKQVVYSSTNGATVDVNGNEIKKSIKSATTAASHEDL